MSLRALLLVLVGLLGCKPANNRCTPNRGPAADALDPATASRLTIAGDTGSTDGIFDPSPVYPAGASAGALAYSSVPDQLTIRTRLAVSSDLGATWQFAAEANAPSDLTVDSTDAHCSGGRCTGKLIHEVPSLVHDPEDPDAARRWKLFTHSYLNLSADVHLYDYGFIALFTAPAPEGPWSPAEKLLGWNSLVSPFSSTGVTQNLSQLPELSDCVAFTEPGALFLPGRIDLALGCVVAAASPAIRIVLLRSTDHARSFQYVAAPLAAEDAQCIGASVPQLNAAHLFVAAGKVYLSVSPAGPVTPGFSGYRGCVVFELQGDTIPRDAGGAPIIVRRLDTTTEGFNGACAVAEGASAMGYLVPTLYSTQPRFRILRSGTAAP